MSTSKATKNMGTEKAVKTAALAEVLKSVLKQVKITVSSSFREGDKIYGKVLDTPIPEEDQEEFTYYIELELDPKIFYVYQLSFEDVEIVPSFLQKFLTRLEADDYAKHQYSYYNDIDYTDSYTASDVQRDKDDSYIAIISGDGYFCGNTLGPFNTWRSIKSDDELY